MYRENNELLYVYHMIKEEDYLKKLLRKIDKDSTIADNCTPKLTHRYEKSEVIDSLTFFKDMGISLHDVYYKDKNKIKLGHPKDIRIVADYYNESSEVYLNYDKDIEYIDSIRLSFNPKRNSIISYFHEITHTQATNFNNKQMIDDTHEELLPIFIELLAAKEMGEDYYTNYRLNELAFDIHMFYNADNDYDKFAYATYIKSTLKAFKLLKIYQESDVRVKKTIMKDIQSIFDGKLNVETLLNMYKVTYKNSKMKLKDIKHI